MLTLISFSNNAAVTAAPIPELAPVTTANFLYHVSKENILRYVGIWKKNYTNNITLSNS